LQRRIGGQESRCRDSNGGPFPMRRQMLVLASVALVAFAGCRHHCRKACDSCAPPIGGSSGARPILLPPAGVPTTPGGGSPVPSVGPGPSGFLPPSAGTPAP